MKDIEKYTVSEKENIRTTLKRLDQGALGFIVVVTVEKQVLGVITDGDFRRAILKGVSLDDNVLSITNRNFKFLKEGYKQADAKELFKNPSYRRVPILKDGRLIDIITADDFNVYRQYPKTDRIKHVPVVIMAGGKGSRLEPFTKILPKPLIPVGEKAIIDHIMDEFKNYGISEFFLTLNYKGEMIKAYFNNENNDDLTLHFIDEKEYLGSAGSLSLLCDDLEDDFIVTNCDIIVKADYANVMDFHKKKNAVLTVISSLQHLKIPYGVLDFDHNGHINRIVEKPENSITVNTGVYVMNRQCLDLIPKNTYFDMPTLISKLISMGKNVLTYPVNESEYIDIGQWEQYKQVLEQIQRLI